MAKEELLIELNQLLQQAFKFGKKIQKANADKKDQEMYKEPLNV